MFKIIHRVNSKNKLIKFPSSFGIEIDLRSNFNHLYLQHDPFKNGERLENFLKYYNHKFLVIHTKEAGLEKRCMKILKTFKI